MKKFLKYILYILTAIILFAIMFIGYLTVTEYNPNKIETININNNNSKKFELNKQYNILNWNIGFAGMDENIDFFMDGGKMVLPSSEEQVKKNLDAIGNFIKSKYSDVVFLQEVDENSKRTYNFNQIQYFDYLLNNSSNFAYNYKVAYVPYPFPETLGKMNSGIYTSTKFNLEKAERHQLPVPFKYPVRIANLKRAISVSYAPIENSTKKLVLINAHLDAYDSDNSGKIAQTKEIINFLNDEYNKGNYVIVGADFNQSLTENIQNIPSHLWQPSKFDESKLAPNFKLYFDETTPTARLLNKPYIENSTDTYTFVIDGYIVSNNIDVVSVKTEDLKFKNSDHNPILLEFKLK